MNRKILAFVSLVLALMLCMTGCTQQPAESADPTKAPAAGTDAPQAQEPADDGEAEAYVPTGTLVVYCAGSEDFAEVLARI